MPASLNDKARIENVINGITPVVLQSGIMSPDERLDPCLRNER